VGGVAGSGIPLGVLPCGTGNLLARNLALPLSLDEALTVALTGSDRRLDVGTANGRPFVVMAGIGFDAEMLEGGSEELKKHMGWAAYVLSALRHLGAAPQQDRMPPGELLGVVTQPCANRRQRKLNEQRPGERLTTLARWRVMTSNPAPTTSSAAVAVAVVAAVSERETWPVGVAADSQAISHIG
jgi:hypothetical protein